MGERVEKCARQLVRASKKHAYATFGRVAYPDALNSDRLQFPEKLVSLFYHPIYAELSDEQKWQLSLLEMVNFFSYNIQGEKLLVSNLAMRLYADCTFGPTELTSEYMQHFIEEENSHTFMLANYCNRYHGMVMPDTAIAFEDPQLSPAGQDLIFFARVLVFEHFLDFLNKTTMDDENVDSLVQQIHHLHHVDEARHLAFDRAVTGDLADTIAASDFADELDVIGPLVEQSGRYAVKRLYNPSIYRMIGLEDAFGICQEAQSLAARQRIVDDWLGSGLKFLHKVGLCGAPTN